MGSFLKELNRRQVWMFGGVYPSLAEQEEEA